MLTRGLIELTIVTLILVDIFIGPPHYNLQRYARFDTYIIELLYIYFTAGSIRRLK